MEALAVRANWDEARTMCLSCARGLQPRCSIAIFAILVGARNVARIQLATPMSARTGKWSEWARAALCPRVHDFTAGSNVNPSRMIGTCDGNVRSLVLDGQCCGSTPLTDRLYPEPIVEVTDDACQRRIDQARQRGSHSVSIPIDPLFRFAEPMRRKSSSVGFRLGRRRSARLF